MSTVEYNECVEDSHPTISAKDMMPRLRSWAEAQPEMVGVAIACDPQSCPIAKVLQQDHPGTSVKVCGNVVLFDGRIAAYLDETIKDFIMEIDKSGRPDLEDSPDGNLTREDVLNVVSRVWEG